MCASALPHTPGTNTASPEPVSETPHVDGGQCAWVTSGPVQLFPPHPRGPDTSMTPDQPLPRWNPILRWSFGSCSHQCTALRSPVPKLGPSLMTGTCWRSSATSTDRRSWCDVLFCEPNENAAALALVPPVPPRRSHTCTIPRPDPAMTVWPSSLARAQLNGEWRSVGAVSSARGKPPAHRSSQRYTRPRRPAASTRLPSPGQNMTSSRPAPCPSPVLPDALPAFSASKVRAVTPPASRSTISTAIPSLDAVATASPPRRHATDDSDRWIDGLPNAPRRWNLGSYSKPSLRRIVSQDCTVSRPPAVAAARYAPVGSKDIDSTGSPAADTAAPSFGLDGSVHVPTSVRRSTFSDVPAFSSVRLRPPGSPPCCLARSDLVHRGAPRDSRCVSMRCRYASTLRVLVHSAVLAARADSSVASSSPRARSCEAKSLSQEFIARSMRISASAILSGGRCDACVLGASSFGAIVESSPARSSLTAKAVVASTASIEGPVGRTSSSFARSPSMASIGLDGAAMGSLCVALVSSPSGFLKNPSNDFCRESCSLFFTRRPMACAPPTPTALI